MFPSPREGKPESVVVRDGEVGAGSSWLLLCLAWFFNKVSFWKQRLKTFFFFFFKLIQLRRSLSASPGYTFSMGPLSWLPGLAMCNGEATELVKSTGWAGSVKTMEQEEAPCGWEQN